MLYLLKVHQNDRQESPADADKTMRRRSIQKLLQFDVFSFISPNSISPNFKLPIHSVAQYV